MTRPKILCVDDEPNVLSACKRLLRRAGFDVTTTTEPMDVGRLVQTEAFAVVVSDQRMPGLEGTDLLEDVRRLSPDTVRILLTGYADVTASIDAINRGAVFRYVTKPWNDDELVGIIQQAADNYRLTVEHRELTQLTQAQNEELRELNSSLEQRVEERTQEVRSLAQRLDETLSGTTEVLGQLAERHSPTLGNHSRRVAKLALQLGEQLELSSTEMFQLRHGAALHDIGKLGVSPDILAQPRSQLTDIQRELLDQHVGHGESLVSVIPNMEAASRFVRHHHEHYDGNGFPDQLCREDIPLGARIVAVADAFDNLLNSRDSYGETSPRAALELIRHRSGSWFDPRVVAALESCVQAKAADGESTQESELEIHPDDMVEGMVLARDLTSCRGLLLLNSDTVLNEESIALIQRFVAAGQGLNNVVIRRAVTKCSGSDASESLQTEQEVAVLA